MTHQCPKAAELSAFVHGNVDEASADSIADHIEHCPACDATVVGLEREAATVFSRARKTRTENRFEEEPECQRLLAAASQLPDAITLESAPELSTATPPVSLRDYRILEKIGEGGMGAVYKALHTRLDRVVALKALPLERTRDEQSISRFAREMKAVGKLDHPNIVRAMDAGDHEGQHYLAMEFVQGVDLSQLVRSTGQLPIAEACEIIRQAAEGLQHAHEHGLVHRDIKPGNIMLTDHGQVKILDLGLALLSAQAGDAKRELTTTGQIMGTLDYMAPEQGGNTHGVDIRADLYALGATLYKLLTGDAPFAGEKYNSPMQKLMALATEKVPDIRDRRSDVPRDLAVIIERLLAKSPADRFATPAELSEAMLPFCEAVDLPALAARATGRPVPIGPSKPTSASNLSRASAAKRPVPTGRKSIRWYAAVGAGLAGLVLLAVLLTIRTPRGIVEIELADGVDAKNVAIALLRGGEEINIADEAHGWNIRVADGTYDVKLQGTSDDIRLDKQSVTVARDKKAIVRVLIKEVNGASAKGGPEQGSPRIAVTNAAAPGASPVEKLAALHGPWKAGFGKSSLPGIVQRPAKLTGLKGWQMQTRAPYLADEHDTRWSPDGKYLAVCNIGGVRICRIEGERFLVDYFLPDTTGHAGPGAVSADWTPDGKILAVAHQGGVSLWDTDQWRLSKVVPLPEATAPLQTRFSLDGKWLAVSSGSRGRVYLVQTPEGALRRVIQASDPSSPIMIGWNHDSTQVVVGPTQDRKIRVFSTDGTLQVEVAPEYDFYPHLAVSPDGRKLALISNRGLFLCDMEGKQQKKIMLKDGRGGYALGWYPDSRRLLLERDGCQITVFDCADESQQTITMPPPSLEKSRYSFAMHPQEPLGVCVSSDQVYLLRDGNATPLVPTAQKLLCASVTSAPARLIFGTYKDRLRIQAEDGSIESHTLLKHAALRYAASPDGRLVAVGTQGHQMLVCDLATGEPIFESEDGLYDLRWHSSGRWLAWATRGRVRVLSVAEPSRPREFRHPDEATNLDWHPRDGRLLFGCKGGTIGIYNVEEDRIEQTWPAKPNSVPIWSPDGKQIAVGEQSDTVRIISAINGETLREFKTPGQYVSPVFWPLPNRLLVNDRGGAWLLDADTGEQVWQGPGGFGDFYTSGVPNVSTEAQLFTPDRGRLLTKSGVLELASGKKTDFPVGTDCHGLGWAGDRPVRLTIEAGTSWQPGPWLQVNIGEKEQYTVVPLPNGRTAAFDAAGNLVQGTVADIDDYLLCYFERDDGSRRTLRPAEFYEKYLSAAP